MRNFFLLIISTICFACTNTNSRNKSVSEQGGKQTLYYSNGEIKEKFVKDKNGLKQGDYKFYNQNGKIKKTCFYHNDTVIGFTSFYDENGRLNEKKSTFYLDGEITTGERVLYKYDSLNQYKIGGAFFATTTTKAGDTTIIQFTPYLNYNYDSVVVSLSTNCKQENRIEYFKYGNFELKINDFDKECEKLDINMKLFKKLSDNSQFGREIKRVYLIQEGKLLTRIWSIKNEIP